METVPELKVAEEIFNRTWPGEHPPVPVHTMRAMVHSGGTYVAVADRGGEAVGAVLGFVGLEDRRPYLHSHVMAVRPDVRSGGVGRALKLDQRRWTLEHGMDRVTWTFDPLVRKNAYLNFARLGVYSRRYYEDFYGVMEDPLNANDYTDRVLVEWDLASERVIRASEGHVLSLDVQALLGQDAAIVLRAGPDGYPVITPDDAECLLLELPEDINQMRREDLDRARGWRRAQREVLSPALRRGYVIQGVSRDGWMAVRQTGGRAPSR